jgi:hypothetical protein
MAEYLQGERRKLYVLDQLLDKEHWGEERWKSKGLLVDMDAWD